MKYLINAILIVALAVFTIQCEVVSDDLLDNPNNPSPDQASADFLLNSIQLGTVNFFGNIENEASDMTRTTHMFAGTYPSAYQPQFFDTEWSTAYATVLIDVQTVIPVAQGRELFTHEAIARLMKAYVLISLADRFGDVPVNEALDSGNFNPAPESGRVVYQTAFAEIDSARIALGKEALAEPSDDLFYDGDEDNWLTFANTLELKALYQQHKISDPVLPEGVSDFLGRINTLLAGDVIRTADQSFVFQYGTNTSNPDTRHPYFTGNYLTGAGTYMANYYMNQLWNDKSVPDPRIRFYLYRQVNEPTTDVNEQECVGNLSPPSWYRGNGDGIGPNDPWCVEWNDAGYWGRDHGDNDGIPPDNLLRTTYGVYPGGGRFDADQAEGVSDSQGLQGAGIRPIWMHFFTDFVEAEVELAQGNTGPAATALENGITNSMEFVMDFSAEAVTAAGGDADSLATEAENNMADYITDVLDRWTNAANDRERETILANEYHLALFGNGVEAYNLYRRVAPERNDPWWRMQPNLITENPGQFYNTVIYPAAFVQRNSNANTKGAEVRPFWMTADPSFGNF
jgi:hypothetical protein